MVNRTDGLKIYIEHETKNVLVFVGYLFRWSKISEFINVKAKETFI